MVLQDKPKFSLMQLLISAEKRVQNVAKSDDYVCDPVMHLRCQKQQKLGVGIAVCRQDRAYKHYTGNSNSTSSFLYVTILWHYWEATPYMKKWFTCVVFVCPVLPVHFHFYTYPLHYWNIFVCVHFCCTIVHHSVVLVHFFQTLENQSETTGSLSEAWSKRDSRTTT